MSTNFPNGLKSRGTPVEAFAELGKVWGEPYFVDAAEGSDTNTGKDISKAFATISAAINTASTADTVYVRNGAYTETLTLSYPVRIIGESREGVIITAGGDAIDGVTITASNAELYNLTFIGAASGASTVVTAQPGLVVNNCHFGSTASAAIELTSGADDASIINCKFGPMGAVDARTIACQSVNDGKIENCTFTLSDNGAATHAIEHLNADNLDVSNCTAWSTRSDDSAFGSLVYITGSDGALYNLTIHDCEGHDLAALIVESSTSLAQHGFGTADLVNVESSTQMGYNNNYAFGCTLFFDTAD